MNLRDLRHQPFVKDLTRTRHMTVVSAVVLATIFMPLLGLPNVEQLRVIQGAVERFSDARAEARTLRRDDEAARERMLQSVVEERDEDSASTGFVDRVLTVIRPARQNDDTLDTADIMPLPPVEDPSYAEADESEDEVELPELVEEPDVTESEDEYYEEEEPILEEEEEF